MTALVIALIIGFGIPAAFVFGKDIGSAETGQRVRRLWDSQGGWIPGGAIADLEEAIQTPLKTSQELRKESSRED